MAQRQTKIEQEVRALCEERGIDIWDSTESYVLMIDEDSEIAIVYHDGLERLRQSEITAQWHDAYCHISGRIYTGSR